ncbi:MAG: hypothetical protein KDI15_04650, partial [Thiothrix sp.]|nr:hypothetical protein [Thiothrix sp.]
SVREIRVPAVYQTYQRLVLKQPDTTREVSVAPVSRTFSHEVLVSPATTRRETEPARFQEVPVRQLAQAAYPVNTEQPPEYQQLERHLLERPGGILEQHEVDCPPEMTSDGTGSRTPSQPQ